MFHYLLTGDADEKTVSPVTCFTDLGYELDYVAMEIRIPLDKLKGNFTADCNLFCLSQKYLYVNYIH